MTFKTSSRRVIDRVFINFDQAANYHVYYRWAGTDNQAGEAHCTITHRQTFQNLSQVEAFLFRIDPHKSSPARTNILQKLVSIGFTVHPSGQSHYHYYAYR